MAISVLLLTHDDDRFALRSAFDRVFVDTLKTEIPPACREWDALKKMWYIDNAYADVVGDLVESLDGHIMDKRPQGVTTVGIPVPLRDACTLLYVTPDAPISVAEAAFKALAKRHHPDVGGDTETMQRLNNALSTFKAFSQEVPF
jgi:hypothetical protein